MDKAAREARWSELRRMGGYSYLEEWSRLKREGKHAEAAELEQYACVNPIYVPWSVEIKEAAKDVGRIGLALITVGLLGSIGWFSGP